MANPVGTGPYRLKEWRRGQKIVLEANPALPRGIFSGRAGSGPTSDAGAGATMKGKRLPQIGRIEIAIIEESNPQLLAFNTGELDYANVPADLVPRVLDPQNRLLPEYASQGVTAASGDAAFAVVLVLQHGRSRSSAAMRRKRSRCGARSSWRSTTPDLVRVWYQGQAMAATQPIPPGRRRATSRDFDARAPLRSGDGQGAARPLRLQGPRRRRLSRAARRQAADARDGLDSDAAATASATSCGKRAWTAIGIRIDFIKQKWPDLLKMGRAGQLQMWPVGWITTARRRRCVHAAAVRPEHRAVELLARFRNAEYDELYRQSKRVPDGPERKGSIAKMAEIVAAYNPWDLGVYRYENTLVRPWVLGYKKHIYDEHAWKYYDIDVARQKAGK